MLEIRNLSKSLGENPVLKHCSLKIEEGKVFGLVGVNGAGKSTLLRCIAGIFRPEEGEILIDGEPVYENEKIKKQILFISDDPYYPINATVLTLKNFYQTFYDWDEERFQRYFSIFDLPLNKPINNFSKGMKRQVFILISLAIMPKYLILDESFDGLDPLMRLNFKKALTEVLEEGKMTVVIASHSLRELEDICDAFGILENGSIQTFGDLEASKNQIHKIQAAFKDEISEELFKDLDVYYLKKVSHVVTLVVRGDIEEIKQYLQLLNPVLIDVLNVSFEELFIYEIMKKEGKRYE